MNQDETTEVEWCEPADTAPAAASVDLDAVARIVEALLLAADGPLSLDALQRLVGAELNLGRKELRDALARLGERYAGSAAQLCEVASGWRLQVRPEFGEWVGRLWQEKPPKYSRAALETLALVVYRQPITRGEIEDIRGVAVSTNILRTLLERGWVREVGVKESPGRPALFGTTAQFLDDFNLRSLDQLPSLPEVKNLEQLEAAMNQLGLATELAGATTAVIDEEAPPAEIEHAESDDDAAFTAIAARPDDHEDSIDDRADAEDAAPHHAADFDQTEADESFDDDDSAPSNTSPSSGHA